MLKLIQLVVILSHWNSAQWSISLNLLRKCDKIKQ